PAEGGLGAPRAPRAAGGSAGQPCDHLRALPPARPAGGGGFGREEETTRRGRPRRGRHWCAWPRGGAIRGRRGPPVQVAEGSLRAGLVAHPLFGNTRFLTLPLRPPASPPPLYIAGSPRFSLGRSAFDESSGVVSAAEDLAVPLWNPALRKQGPRGPRARARDPKPPDLLAAPPPPSPGVHERARAARDGPPARAGTAAPLTAGRSGAKPCESRAREDVARARGDS
ncbi:unnamed protein product, partial [Prorocentrum cordatum]